MIGEITSSIMVVVLNKVDQIPEASRAVQIEKVKVVKEKVETDIFYFFFLGGCYY